MLKTQPTQKADKQLVKDIFTKLPMHLKVLVTKADIQFVINARHTYQQLKESPEENITAFLSEMQYIKGEASKVRSNISKEAIKAILAAEETVYPA